MLWESYTPGLLLKPLYLFLKNIYFVYECFANMHVCIPRVHLVSLQARRGCWTPQDKSYRKL